MKLCGNCKHYNFVQAMCRARGGYKTIHSYNMACRYYQSEKLENKMNNIEITVKVNGKEIPLSDISTETFEKIKKADAPLKLGDIIESTGGFGKRVVLFDEHRQCLVAFSANGCAVAWADINMYYKKTGQNIFDDNLLGLNV